mmetsp:Transcript_43272/g.100342  ORF Transcript_43272/g.100342 Transcript_43272/m.100342 type:complete len:208 (+) Transcript_43272:39-662(+)
MTTMGSAMARHLHVQAAAGIAMPSRLARGHQRRVVGQGCVSQWRAKRCADISAEAPHGERKGAGRLRAPRLDVAGRGSRCCLPESRREGARPTVASEDSATHAAVPTGGLAKGPRLPMERRGRLSRVAAQQGVAERRAAFHGLVHAPPERRLGHRAPLSAPIPALRFGAAGAPEAVEALESGRAVLLRRRLRLPPGLRHEGRLHAGL